MTVVFFGHAVLVEDIGARLGKTIRDLISENEKTSFLVGDCGQFDFLVQKIMKRLKAECPTVRYTVVLSYMPPSLRGDMGDGENTVFPECVAAAPRKFAIDRRNRWMCEQADLAVTYVKRKIGGAAKFKRFAERREIPIIELAGESETVTLVPSKI